MPEGGVEPLRRYLQEIRRIRATGHQTAEQSFYGPLTQLLDSLCETLRPSRRVLNHPHGIDGDFPDLAVYEQAGNVLALPIEVKPASYRMSVLLASDQAKRYATSFGGGLVLLTNLRQFTLGRLDGTSLNVVGTVELVGEEEDFDEPSHATSELARDLTTLLEEGCKVRGSLTDPRRVAEHLAYHARQTRDSITSSGNPDALLAPIRRAFSQGLNVEIADDFLVPTIVQTLIYGLFTAWIDDPDPTHFDWVTSALRAGVPVFGEILHATLSPAIVRECDLTPHLDAVRDVLTWVDRANFEDQFDGGAIEYFYEPFLAEFDPHLRDRLGVWYTPREIADYQVARTDHHLRQDLGITDGIADPSVLVLDPACGTGTYLAAVLRSIYKFHCENGEPESVAAARTCEAAESRIIGFEILPAAFIISHLHLNRILRHYGVTRHSRLRVYLTNALTGWEEGAELTDVLFPELEHEIQDANVVKRRESVLAVLGNPPYQGYSSAETAEELEAMKAWLDPLWPQWHLRKHRLNDLYVRFWNRAIEKITVLTGRGVVSFITNRKWLGGRSYPTMREAVVTNFQKVIVDDLHGAMDDRTHPGDQSIFSTSVATGITRGTAIVTAVLTARPTNPSAASVYVRDFRGPADDKRSKLATLASGSDIDSGLHLAERVNRDNWYRLSQDPGSDFPSVDEYLTFFWSGVQPVRDEAVLSFDRAQLEVRMRDYFDSGTSTPDLIERYPGFGVTRARYDAEATRAKLLANSGFHEERIVPFLYRPFDVRWMYWEPDYKLLNEARRELMPYWIRRPEQRGLVLPQTPRRYGAFRPVVTSAVASFACAEPDARVMHLIAPPQLHGVRQPGLAVEFDDSDSSPEYLVAAEWVDDSLSVTAETIFYALVAIMNSPAWLDDQPVDADDFPPVPLPDDHEALVEAARLGRRIAELNDPLVNVGGVTTGSIDAYLAGVAVPDQASGVVEIQFGRHGSSGGRRVGDSVEWSEGLGWRNVPDSVWSFTACGHQVLPKWLSYRKNVGLDAAGRQEFMLIARRIAAIRALEDQCDRLFESANTNPLSPRA
jgi:Type ISP C-terminal specificity domain